METSFINRESVARSWEDCPFQEKWLFFPAVQKTTGFILQDKKFPETQMLANILNIIPLPPQRDECQRLLTSSAFADCRLRLNLEMYIQACMQDKCACNGKEDSFCLCSTISEYSRQCSHAGGRPAEWRTENFCRKQLTKFYKYPNVSCM